MYIYKLTNIKNNKIYIGLTTLTIERRCAYRNHEAKYRMSRNSYILNAIRKHGSENFIAEQIDTASNLEELKQKEIGYIKLYNSTDRKIGYNLTKGGDGSFGMIKSEETKEKIRQKALLRGKWSEERKKKHSELFKLKDISNWKSGIENCKAYNLKTSKAVVKLNENLEVIKTYNSITEVAKEEKLDRTGIMAYLKKKDLTKRYKGELYKYKD